MSLGWNSTTFSDEAHALDKLTELRGNRWMCRGQPERYGCLRPSIDRDARECLSRVEKLKLERQSIDLFQSTARFFTDEGEKAALRDDVVALMVMRHYGVPTRLLDWSQSPFVAAFFACEAESKDGELRAFSHDKYLEKGNEQWQAMPEASRDKQFHASYTAFTVAEPPDWFVCQFYTGFPRQVAQLGFYTMTGRLGRRHDEKIATFLGDPTSHHLYVIPSRLKPKLLKLLRESHGIWRGSLFPDPAGAAATVIRYIFASGSRPVRRRRLGKPAIGIPRGTRR